MSGVGFGLAGFECSKRRSSLLAAASRVGVFRFVVCSKNAFMWACFLKTTFGCL